MTVMRAHTQHKWPWNDTFRTRNTCVRNFQTCLQHMWPWVLWGHSHNTNDHETIHLGPTTHVSVISKHVCNTCVHECYEGTHTIHVTYDQRIVDPQHMRPTAPCFLCNTFGFCNAWLIPTTHMSHKNRNSGTSGSPNTFVPCLRTGTTHVAKNWQKRDPQHIWREMVPGTTHLT